MKASSKQIKWLGTSLLAFSLTNGAYAFESWNHNFVNKWSINSHIINNEEVGYIYPILHCVTVPELPNRFQRTTTRTKVMSQSGYTELEVDIKNVTPTFISADTAKYTYSGVVEVEGGVISAVDLEYGEITSSFSIADGFKDITEETYVARDYLYEDNHSYSAFLRKASGVICENKTWNSSYYHTSEVIREYPISAIFPESTINTIEAVNVAKTVEAGTFTTYQHKVEYGNKTNINWVDIETGVLVASESRNASSDELIATKELIDLVIPILGTPPVLPNPMKNYIKTIKTKSIIPAVKYFK